MIDELKALPHAVMAEKSILSVMFRDPRNIARASAEGLTAESFYLPAHQELLSRIIMARDAEAFTDDGEIDIGILIQSAHMDGALDRIGGPSEVYSIATYAIGLSGWTAWGDQMRECQARRIALAASKAISEAQDSGEAMQAAQDALDAMRRTVTAKTRAMNAKQAGDDFLRQYIASFDAGDIPGDSTGIEEIDQVTGGMRKGELWTIGGKSSSGKSVLMFQMASGMVMAGKPVAIFSLELMPHEIIGRLVTLAAKVRHDAITKPKTVNKSEMGKIKMAVETLQESKLWIDASASQTLDTIVSEAERIRDIEGDLSLIVVDYIQIVTGNRNKGESREQEIARVSGGLKQLAKRMGCPVITGSQLNEQGQTRESRAVEQDSDALLIIEDGSILLKKVRNGERGSSINLALDGSAQRFRYCSTD
jgi:replicative DNA helicase